MRCPIDNTDLLMTERNGIEIDYCPKCRGVWLDRGELDKLIERAAQFEQRIQPSAPRQPNQPYRDYDDDRRYGDYPEGKRKRRGFLDDVFDIFD